MRTRLGASLAAAAVAALWASPSAYAGHTGATKYSACCQPACDAQTNFGAAAAQSRAGYQVVYDTVVEKRFHTCYQTVTETVMKPVTRTCYRDEVRTTYKTVHETAYRQVTETVCRPH